MTHYLSTITAMLLAGAGALHAADAAQPNVVYIMADDLV